MRGPEGGSESSLNLIVARSVTTVRSRGRCDYQDLLPGLLYAVCVAMADRAFELGKGEQATSFLHDREVGGSRS